MPGLYVLLATNTAFDMSGKILIETQ